jgi:alkylation response protein AidB-like acyl-CoA dehydrogenase
MARLGFERGVSTLGQQMHFYRELTRLPGRQGQRRRPESHVCARLAHAWMGLKVMRYNALRMLSGPQDGSLQRPAMIYKYYWVQLASRSGQACHGCPRSRWRHRRERPVRTRLQQLFLFSRADTIYAGTNEIQLNIIAERALGMPREPRPSLG